MATKKISELEPGDMIDLEGDRYADPNRGEYGLAYEYAVVEAIERETHDCIVVYFENFVPVGFPPDHVVELGEPAHAEG